MKEFRFSGFAALSARAFAFLVALSPALTADDVVNATIDNPGGYVLASDADNGDPGYDRDAVQFGFVHQASAPGLSGGEVTYRYTYRLRDLIGDPVQILDADGAPVTERVFVDTVVFPSDTFFLPVERDFRLPPAGTLGRYVPYWAHVTIERWDGDQWQPATEGGSNLNPLIHFTHTDSDDAALNVVSTLDGAAVSETTVVDTVDGLQTFRGSADLTLRRWDGFDAASATTDSVTVHFDLELRRADDNTVVPLAQSRVTKTFDIAGFAAGTDPREPAEETFNDVAFDFLPANQLDSVASEYRVHVAVSHVDTSGASPEPGNTRQTAAERLLHFNGTLLFGNIRGQVGNLDAVPGTLGVSAGAVTSELLLAEGGGSIEGTGDIVFGDGSALPVDLLPNGDAEYTGADPVLAGPGEGYEAPVHGGLRMPHSQIELSTGGALAPQLTVFLPAGAGILVADNFHASFPFLQFPDVDLDQAMLPTATTLTLPLTDRKFTVESMPLFFILSQVDWHTDTEELTLHTTDAVFIQEDRYAYLENPDAGLANTDAANRYSNDKYFRHVTGTTGNATLRTGANGEALLSCELQLGSGEHRPHFPYGSLVEWEAGGQLHYVDGRIATDSSYLDGVVGLLQVYEAGCPDGNCGGGSANPRYGAIEPDGARAYFTPDGGLHAAGTTMATSLFDPFLEWGMVPFSPATHETDAFARANYYMPGNVLSGSDFPAEAEKAPGTLLLSGVDPDDPTVAERPGETAYEAGLGDYAGLNFRVDNSVGDSRLGGELFTFPLSARSKYYTRWSGVSGIHEAQEFNETRDIYGYPFSFSNFGLSFLSGENHDSRLNGQVSVPEPSDFTQEFEEMTLTCQGALDDARPPENDNDKELQYWAAVFSTYSIRFEPDASDPCDPSTAYLTLATGTEPGSLATRLYGTLGFFNNGELIAEDNSHLPLDGDGPAGIDSRLTAPASLEVAGPGEDTYVVHPAADLYYNSHALRDQTEPEAPGFLSLAAGMNVPFFEQLQAQLHLSPLPGEGEEDDIFARLYYVMGGWPDTTAGWTDGQDRHFFNFTGFDRSNRGYPGGETLDHYRNPTRNDTGNAQYLVRAQKQWLGVIPFDYPLKWDPVNRAFRSPENIENDLMVLEVEHQVRYLDTTNAEISFGARYDGLPEINVTNMLYEAVDEQFGAAQALVDSAGQALFDELIGGVDGFSRLLDDQVRKIFRELFDEGVDPLLDELADEINAELVQFGTDFDVDPDEFIGDQTALLNEWDNHIATLESELTALHVKIRDEIAALAGGTQSVAEAPVNLIDKIDDELARVQRSVRTLLVTMPDSVEVDEDKIAELLPDVPEGQAGRILEVLVGELIGKELPGLAASLIEEPLAELMETAEPTLAQIATFLERIDDKITAVRESLHEQGQQVDSFAAEIRAEIAGAQQEIEGVVDTVFEEALTRLESLPRADYRFDELTYDPNLPAEEVDAVKEELKTFLRESFEDAFFESDIVRSYHRVVRQRLFDIYLEQQETVDTLFAQVNDMVKELITETAGAAEEQVNEVVGELSDKIGAGEIVGHAHIQGDALRLLRLDGTFEFQVPDEMELKAYLQIKQLRSDGTEGCAAAETGRTVETTIGALDIPLEWLTPDLRADVETRFSFDTGGSVPVPRGLAGSFVMTGGTINFESFEISELVASMAFSASDGGVDEAYISTALAMGFNGYEASGGVFFGRACSLHPIEIWDPEVAGVLGDPPFTGAYVYGEVWIPVSEALLGIPSSCMFRVSAGVGTGFFYFLEGPTYGGKLFAGLSGEVLCLVSVRGELSMVGVKEGGGSVNLTGNGFVKGTIGVDPFSKSIRKDVLASYIGGSWDVDLK